MRPSPLAAFQPLAFTGHPGLTLQLSDVDDPLETSKHFIDDAMINEVVIQTNLRARQLASAPGLKLSSRIRKWKDVTAEEISLSRNPAAYGHLPQA